MSGDLEGGDESPEDAVSVGEVIGAPDDLAIALCERSLMAMAHSARDRAEVLAERARAVLPPGQVILVVNSRHAVRGR